MKSLNASDVNNEDSGGSTQPKKIRRTVSSMVKIMEVTEEEQNYRTLKFDRASLVKKYRKYLKCTKCDMGFQESITKGEELGVHPLLSVLMCDSCRDYYGDGEFSLDSEGEDKYCRWCGEGGTIFSCSLCICGFCDICIKKHFGEGELQKVERDDDWTCYLCNNKPLWDLRSICSLATEASKAKKKELNKIKVKNRKRKNLKRRSETDDVESSSSDASFNVEYYQEKVKKQKKLRKTKNNCRRDSSSSSEADKENSSRSKKGSKSKKKSRDNDTTDSDSVNRSKVKADTDTTFENKKALVLNKFKSIWKLTQTIASVGLTLSKKKMKQLEDSNCFKNLEDLQTEHYDLQSFTATLASSLKTAASSVDSFKEDLSFDSATDETEIFREHERKIISLAKKLGRNSKSDTSTVSDSEDSSRRESKEKTNNSERQTKPKKAEEKTKKETEGLNNPENLVKDSNCGEDQKNENSTSKELVKTENCEPRRPLLRVKAFAKMLDDNVLLQKKENKVVEVYDIASDKSGDECENTGSLNQSVQTLLCSEKMNDIIEKISTNDNTVEKSRVETSAAEVRQKKNKQKSSVKKNNQKSFINQLNESNVDSTLGFEVVSNEIETNEDEEIVKSKDSENQERNSEVVVAANLGKKRHVNVSDEENTGKKKLENNRRSKKKKQVSDQGSSSDENREKKDKKCDQESSSDEKSKKNKKSDQESSSNVKTIDKGKKSDEESTGNDKTKNKSKKSDEESSDESIVAKRRKKKANDDTDSSDQELTIRKTRSKNKSNQSSTVDLFEKFKEKRESFIKTRKENLQKDVLPKGKKNNAEVLEKSKNDGSNKTVKQKKKFVIDSSDEDQGNKDGIEDEKSETNTSGDEPEIKKRKRKRKKKNSDSSGEDRGKSKKKEENSSDSNEDEQKKKKGRKNIKKILKKDSLKLETKEALKNEEARKKRIKERQKLFEKLFPEQDGKIILDFDPETKEPLVTVHKKLAKKLRPHQAKGVKFMWDNCFESIERLEEDSGSGCILAHCMGLGKTLQVVTLVHTVMTHDLGVNSVLIICPLSTVTNWIREFEFWLANVNTEPLVLFNLVKYKKREERQFYLRNWHESGGVLVVSYDLFRTLTKSVSKKERKTKYKQTFITTLLDPGPDLVICDEGHLLKNEDTALSKCVNQIKTSRRIVLTGTPLQNNLLEYHCMVQFVKPNILGTKKEFCNRFVNPIKNGQFEDSTEFDVKIMKRRSHVLHSMLEGCVQRFDYSVLTPFLPEKHEYVLSVSLTEKQANAYKHFIMSLSAKSQGNLKGRTLFNDYHNLQRIWTHPRTLLLQSEREERNSAKDEEDSLDDFIATSDEESGTQESGSSDSDEKIQPKKRILRSNANDPDVIADLEEEEKSQTKYWWDEFFDEEAMDNLRESNKLILLFSLLNHCKKVNDKILVFSQSLYSLDLIEYFLNQISENSEKNSERLCGYTDTWHLNTDYFRLDGSTSSEQRASWCNYFNKESNTRARLFLISTRAGGLGINLYGANRVVVFDASWNPSHDLQSIFRVYRFGQKKPCYIYRFLAEGTMEEKIYERQVTKLSLAHRVVDEHQIERHYTMGNLLELYEFKPREERSIPIVPKDSVLAELLQEHKDVIVAYHEHDSLLENKEEEELTEEERKAAWKEYEEEKEKKMIFTLDSDVQQYLLRIQQAYPAQSMRVLNPAYVNTDLMFTNSLWKVPSDILERGIKVGVTPIPNENVDTYVARIIAKENWINATLPEN